MPLQKIKEFPGLTRIATEAIEKHSPNNSCVTHSTISTCSCTTCAVNFCTVRQSCATHIWKESRPSRRGRASNGKLTHSLTRGSARVAVGLKPHCKIIRA